MKNFFIEIFLCSTISEINVFLCFKQKFKTAAINGGKQFLVKKYRIECDVVVSALSCIVSEINVFCDLCRISRWPPKMQESTLHMSWEPKILSKSLYLALFPM